MINLGGNPRKYDPRDIKLGAVQPPVEIPKSYQTDISWLDPIWQDGTPSCGAHAGAHLKMILDHFDGSADKVEYSPRYLWLKIKEIDGYPLEVGTDMRSIFKALANKGVCNYSLLPNSFPTTTQEYSKNVATPEMDANAHPRIIRAYGFTVPSKIKEAIYQNKAVLILADVGDSWWKKVFVWMFKKKDSGHFFIGYGFDEQSISVLDSADKEVPLKKLMFDYPIREVGTAIDIPDWQVKNLTTQISLLRKVVALLAKLLNK